MRIRRKTVNTPFRSTTSSKFQACWRKSTKPGDPNARVERKPGRRPLRVACVARLARLLAARPATGSLSPSRPHGGARSLREPRFRRTGRDGFATRFSHGREPRTSLVGRLAVCSMLYCFFFWVIWLLEFIVGFMIEFLNWLWMKNRLTVVYRCWGCVDCTRRIARLGRFKWNPSIGKLSLWLDYCMVKNALSKLVKLLIFLLS